MEKTLPTLWKHQEEAIKRAKTEKNFGLFFEAGTGKTRTTIEILRNKFNDHRRIIPTIIFCPPVVISNWKAEFLKYSNIPQEKVILLNGSGKKRFETYCETTAPSIFVTNYQAVEMKPLFDKMLERMKVQETVLVLDEAHRIKNPQALRTKKIWQLADLAHYRFILTGTPILNTQMDLFAQIRALDPSIFGKNFWAFRAQYFWDKNAGMPKQKYFPNWAPRDDTAKLLAEKISSITMPAKKSECLDLPPLIRKEISIALSPQQERLYKGMKEDFITFLNDSACVAQLALTKALRLQQIVSGFLKTEDGKEHTFEDNPRSDALKDLLEDLTPANKVIVWAVFKENYKQIARVCEKLGVEYVQLTGETSNKDREEALTKFRNDAKVRVFISNPGAGGIGINLIEASHSIFYSRSFSLEHDLQAEARNYRGGSELHDKVTRIDLIAGGTIDEIICQALSRKQDLGARVLELKNLLK